MNSTDPVFYEDDDDTRDVTLPCTECNGTGLAPEGWHCEECDGLGYFDI